MIFPAKSKDLEAKIDEWKSTEGKLRVDNICSYSGHKVYALTLTDFSNFSSDRKAHYFSQPHAHEPGTTTGMIDVINQLIMGVDLYGNPTEMDPEKVLAETILTFNPIGNPQGREKAPVVYWDGTKYSNEEFWCWMRGEDPENPGHMWKRLDLWDIRDENAPDSIGIVYEQIDEFRYVEPNRSHLSSFFKLFFMMNEEFHYSRWLDLHQMEFENSELNCEMLMPLEGATSGEVEVENFKWAQDITAAWKHAGFKPKSPPAPLNYSGEQAEYFRKNWGALHRKMSILNTEVKNNSPDATPEFQTKAQAVAIITSINRLLQKS